MKFYRKDIRKIGNVFIIERESIIYYGIKSPENLIIGINVIIHGDVVCQKDLTLCKGVIVHGDVVAEKDAVIGSEVKIDDDLKIYGNANILSNAVIKGNIYSHGSLFFANGVKANHIITTGDIILLGSIESKSMKASGKIVG